MKSKMVPLAVLASALLISGCGGGGGDAGVAAAGVSWPAATPNAATSYQAFKEIGLVPSALPGNDNARAYADFTGNGRKDVFIATLTYSTSLPIAQATPATFAFYAQQADGSYVGQPTMITSGQGCIHPRKAIVADFNKDGLPDVFVACHGYDAPPFPGEQNRLLLSSARGSYAITIPSSDVGFFIRRARRM